MKILILSDDFPPRGLGGGASVALGVARGMKERGHEVIVVTSVQKKQDSQPYKYEGLQVYPFHSSYNERWRAYRSLYNPPAISFLRAVFEKEKPDVVHAHNIHYHISYHSLKLAKNYGACVVLTAHDCMLFHYGKFSEFINPTEIVIKDSYDYKISPLSQSLMFRWRYNPFRNIIIKYYLKYVHVICPVSHELKKVLEANGIMNNVVVHNALDISHWIIDESKTHAFIEKHQITNHRRVLFVGKFTHAKGAEQLVKALILAKFNIKNLTLIILGESDSYTANLISNAEKAGIKVVLTGWMPENELPHIYAAAHAVAFPSVCFDTFGMVNIEAMASKKPVIVTCFGGAKEIVEDGVTGYIINPYDTERFGKLLADLLGNSERASAMGEKGHELVKKSFDIKEQTEAYENIYKRI